MRRVVAGDRAALLGLERFEPVGPEELARVASDVWGWDSEPARVSIDPERLIAATAVARARVVDVARRGGRVAVATTRPASLLPLYRAVAALVVSSGGELLDAGAAGPFHCGARPAARLWWLDGVAAITDGDVLLADPGIEAVDELLFTLPRPDLVVGDRAFAGGALQSGIEVVAVADLDAVALGLAAYRGLPVTVVPMHERRPPSSYCAVVDLLEHPPTTPAP